jgi:hypothetical protein
VAVPFGDFSFSKGEIAPGLFGRVDQAAFHSAATTFRNAFVNFKGGAYSRAGTAFVGFSAQTGRAYPPRLVDFQFSILQGLCLEFGNNYMRVVSNGAFVTEAALPITGVTQANPAVITFAASGGSSATPLNTGVTVSYAPGNSIALAGGTYLTPAVLLVSNTLLLDVSVGAPGSGYAPGNTIVPAGGTQSTPAQLTVSTTKVVSATVAAGGSGGTNGTQTVTGTTGTGTLFQAVVNVAGGAITSVVSVTVPGSYTVNPASLTNAPVSGAGLTGAQLAIAMGVNAVTITGAGVFTANPASYAFTQGSTSGGGTGATFVSALMAPNAVTFATSGSYSMLPANPVSQASTSGVGRGVQFTVTWGASTPFANNNWIEIGGVDGMTQLNGNTYILGGVTGTTAELLDVFGNPVNSTTFGTYLSGGTAARIFNLVTPWAEQDLPWLKWTQSADVMSLCCVNQQTETEYPPYDLGRVSDSEWVLTQTTFGAQIGAPSNASAEPTNFPNPSTSPPIYPAAYAYVVTAVNALGEESVASPIANFTNGVDIGATAGSNIVTWQPVTGAVYYNVYRAPTSYNTDPGNPNFAEPVPAGAQFSFVGFSYGTQFVDSNITPDGAQVPPLHTDPFARGVILSITVTIPGSGLTTVTPTITTASGFGEALEPVIVSGGLSAVIVQDGGELFDPGDTISFGGPGAYATGDIAFSINPSNGDTITLDGNSWEFVTSSPGANQTQIQGSLAATLKQLVSDLSVSPLASVALFNFTATELVVTYGAPGAGGNLYTLAASAATPSGPALTGGGVSNNPQGFMTIGPESGTYPGVVSYYQQRRVYAGSLNNPDTYWMSQPGLFQNFDARIPTIATDAITGSPWSLQVNGIQWFLTMPGGLLTFTGNQMWQLTGAGGSGLTPVAITPTDQQAQPQAFNGISGLLPPIQVGYDVLFADAVGSYVYDVTYQYWLNIYTGNDITVFSSHLFDGFSLKEWAWSRQPYKLVWGVRNDGALLSLTFDKEQEVIGWTRHDTQGLFQSTCSVIEPPVNAPYFAVERYLTEGAAYTIERMDNRSWAARENCWCVDCGLALPHNYPGATLNISSATGLGAIDGAINIVTGQNYSPATTGVVIDDNGEGPGSGAVAVVDIVDGAFVGVTFSSNGSGYVRPALVFNDPSGQGSGASATLILNNAAVLTSSVPVFGSGNVGDVVRSGGGVMTIVEFIDASNLTANITSPIVKIIPNSGGIPLPQPAGSWSMDTPVSTISGLGHLAGLGVTGLADGAVIPGRQVTSVGSISLDAPATQVIVGLAFTAQLQSPYLAEAAVQGQRKRIAEVTARLEASGPCMIGSNQPDASTLSPAPLVAMWSNLQLADPSQTSPPLVQPPYGGTVPPLYTGDIRIPIGGGYAKPGQAAIQQSLPLPLQVLALIPETELGDQPQGGKPAAKQPEEQRRGFAFQPAGPTQPPYVR